MTEIGAKQNGALWPIAERPLMAAFRPIADVTRESGRRGLGPTHPADQQVAIPNFNWCQAETVSDVRLVGWDVRRERGGTAFYVAAQLRT